MTRALIVIDIQNDYFPGGVLPLENAQAVETRILSALARAKEAGDRIILIRHQSPLKTGLFADGSPGADLRPGITEAAGDAPVIVKQMADAFQDTDLAQHLEGVTTLVLCGMMTQNCVAFTAMSDMARARETTVAGDLCAAPLDIVHQIALNALGSKMPVLEASEIWG